MCSYLLHASNGDRVLHAVGLAFLGEFVVHLPCAENDALHPGWVLGHWAIIWDQALEVCAWSTAGRHSNTHPLPDIQRAYTPALSFTDIHTPTHTHRLTWQHLVKVGPRLGVAQQGFGGENDELGKEDRSEDNEL